MRCGGEHDDHECQTGNPFYVQDEAPVNHVGSQNRPRNNPYSNTYNPGWRQHPIFSWDRIIKIGHREANNLGSNQCTDLSLDKRSLV